MGVLQALRANKLTPDTSRSPEPRSAACLNCGTPLTGPFCSECGQRDIPPYPSVRELAVDAFWELSGWDGRFAVTVRALLRHPGLLTREFLEGRRARYISPLRLYLMASLAYFVIAAAAPELQVKGKSPFLGVRVTPTVGDSTPSRAERVGEAAGEALEAGRPLTAEQRAVIMKQIAAAPAVLQPFLRRSVNDPAGYKRDILQNLPRMLFALLPVFAAIVSMFYRGRKYPEHLYFAIHLHAFIFLALAVGKLSQFTYVPAIAIATGIVMFLTIPVYATLAFRRTYGGTLVGTLAKEAVITVIYGAICFAAFVAMVYLVSRIG